VTCRVDTTTTFFRRNVSSTKCNRVYFVREFSGGKFIKSVINFGVGRHGGQDAFEVSPVGTVTGVVTVFIIAVLSNGASSRVYQYEKEEQG